MAYVGGGGATNPMQRVTCLHCDGNTQGDWTTCQTCNLPLDHPKVVVFDVGQGNCNALVDARGKILAYFDFGYSTTGSRRPVPPTRPCFCDRPPIILSHWDRDHINLGDLVPDSLTADWIVPEQPHSGFANKLQKKIKQAGGRLLVWPQTKDPLKHITFPWGYVEHGTEPPARGPNGSGLAAYVCVQDDATGPAPRQRAVAPDAIRPAADLQVVDRARQAAALVPATVRRLVHRWSERRAVRSLARPLAAALAASQNLNRRASMPVAECATAAVRATKLALAGVAHAAAANTMNNVHLALPTLRAANAGWATAVLAELAHAAHDACAARGLRARAAAAANRLTPDGTIPAAQWSQMADGASRARGNAPTLRVGHAPRTTRERFILLNGDADFRWLPSMIARTPAMLATLTAMHHGAAFEDGEPLSAEHIPFAPGSWEARAVLRFDPAKLGASMISMVVEAGRALSKRRWKGREHGMRVAAVRTATAAAAVVHAIEAAHPNDLLWDPTKFAYAAAAAAVTAWRTSDPSAIALATVLASTVEKVSADTVCSPLEGVVDLAVAAVAGARAAAPLTPAEAQTLSKGAIDGQLVSAHVVNMAAFTTGAVAAAHNPGNCGQEAASLLTYLWNNYRGGLLPKDQKRFRARISLELNRGGQANLVVDVLNDIADGASAAMHASRHGQPSRLSPRTAALAAGASIGVAGSGLRRLRRSIAATLDAVHGAPAIGVESIARTAAFVAAVRAVAYIIGRSPEAILAVLDAARTHRGRAAARRALRRRYAELGGRIAYSYGVDVANNSHEYISLVAGNMGHPHPIAIEKYKARGWTRRANASNRARHPGLQGDPRNPQGHVALMWDSFRERPHSEGRHKLECMKCRKYLALNR